MDCPKTIIALVGPLGAGKDTLAQRLGERHGFQRFAFADEIKRQYYATSGHSEESFKAARGLPLEKEIRDGLWQYSDRIKRERGQSYFIDMLVAAIQDCPRHAVVIDIRTPEEMDAMRRTGARIVLVLKAAEGEVIWIPDAKELIPGSRLRYGDLQPEDNLFANLESAEPDRITCRIDTWYALRDFVRIGSGKTHP